ncbi:tRNA (adenosine(37)-N6)-threonylcarbamoyltransferase complex transferase subunit TsaD [Zongyangia hominis]|uniref:tRNA N6-adenosine threonylcarbamoyltransferase n=1 Tax=Zongyangia hominis TaxID=2763677 RepID=A0A926EDQ4_9FIRM|nr:tRNA (adenosine(37)-N6)-threonylcarbamoyltransferase complex transferase subunit TsaD [Zongyangia hominis]MBC8570231.1 tRNA (adenosine(37)-N6)-threonylcarbamoyltransferase complex transferase subunit TsaD [Zongyangia hominis]
MKILAIESSCDETAAAVVEDGHRVLSSIIDSQVQEHKIYGGVVPEIASRRHCEAVDGVVTSALTEAGLSLEEVDAVAVTAYPGLIGALLVGVNYAKGLCLGSGKPLIPVHHIRSHIAANYIEHPELTPPFLCLVASGGHSHIIEVRDYTDFHIIGRTRDDAAGEAFDKAARAMGFPYPGGIYIDKASRAGNPDAYKLPRPKVEGCPYDFSFSGLKTAVINLIHNCAQKGEEFNRDDLAASFQKAVVEILSDRLLLAAKELHHKQIVLAGGVSANSGLRTHLKKECAARGYTLTVPSPIYCTDNAVMVGAQAYHEFLAGNVADMSLNACASLPIDQIPTW